MCRVQSMSYDRANYQKIDNQALENRSRNLSEHARVVRNHAAAVRDELAYRQAFEADLPGVSENSMVLRDTNAPWVARAYARELEQRKDPELYLTRYPWLSQAAADRAMLTVPDHYITHFMRNAKARGINVKNLPKRMTDLNAFRGRYEHDEYARRLRNQPSWDIVPGHWPVDAVAKKAILKLLDSGERHPSWYPHHWLPQDHPQVKKVRAPNPRQHTWKSETRHRYFNPNDPRDSGWLNDHEDDYPPYESNSNHH